MSLRSGNIGSTNSGGTGVGSVSVQSRTTGKEKKSAAEVNDRKKIKVLKQAIKDERAKTASLSEELGVVKERNKELTKEHEAMSTKYLALYEENDKL